MASVSCMSAIRGITFDKTASPTLHLSKSTNPSSNVQKHPTHDFHCTAAPPCLCGPKPPQPAPGHDGIGANYPVTSRPGLAPCPAPRRTFLQPVVCSLLRLVAHHPRRPVRHARSRHRLPAGPRLDVGRVRKTGVTPGLADGGCVGLV